MTTSHDDDRDQSDKSQFSRAVAWRLTLAFALLAVLPLAAGITGLYSNSRIQEPLQRVNEITQAVGVHDRAFRRWSRALNKLFTEPRRFENRAAFAESREFVEQAMAGMRSNVELLAANPNIDGTDLLLERQQEFEDGLVQTLQTTDERITAIEQERELVQQILAAGRQITDLTSLAETASADERRALDQIRFSASTLGILAREAIDMQQGQQLTARRGEFAARLRATLQDLTRLPDKPYREELGKAFEQVFAQSIGPDGLFDVKDRVLELRRQEQRERAEVRRIGLRLVDTLGEIDREVDEEAREFLLSAGRAFEDNDIMLIAVGATATLLSLLVMYFYLHGSVLRRLTGLTRSTHRLTHGDLEQPVQVEGRDELAALAQALEVFRSSALKLRKSEQALAERTEELEYLNKELDQFAYVASHDLKAPMRAIDNLANFLREDLGDAVDADSARHLDMMQGRIMRLEGLLDSLLEYSRAGRSQVPAEPVNLRDMVQNCVDIVSPQGAEVALGGSFGQVSTWKTPLEQIVRNLVDNAFKHNDAEHGQVSVECDVSGGMVQLVVADNGPGIEEKNHERIFGMFQTLQARDKVEGSGMGLAILKKLSDTYGGSISVESNPAAERGTRFRVAWPTDAVLPGRSDTDFDKAVLASIARPD